MMKIRREATSSKESASSESKDPGKDETHTRSEIRLQTRDHCLVRVVSACVRPFMIDIK
ncbi:unnamed protein product [Brassica rapa]|uniref:Uncharacterized protein n=1 Tax=Brassica campestris TaxID=3711 RepID=A0A8D9MHU1_BRACM|nr:unnamed protein product [Brassica rapa]